MEYKATSDSQQLNHPPFSEVFAKVSASGKPYEDLEFPAELKSITCGHSAEHLEAIDLDVEELKGASLWVRPNEIYGEGKFQLFEGKIEPNDIKQGQLGNCYFLSTLASLAEKPDRIKRLFETDKVNKSGIYGVKFCEKGEWKTVIIDDRIPCWNDDDGKNPIFSKGNGNEIWVELIEKAWAKHYGGYANIDSGLTSETLHDLTGAPTIVYKTANVKLQDKIWNAILDGEKNNFVMATGAGSFDEKAQEFTGLVQNHAYSLLSAHSVQDKTGQPVKLVKLRNPWGNTEWKGAWSDSSSQWTPELKAALGVENKNDGSFFMAYEEFLKYYEDVQICKIHDDYKYRTLKTTCGSKHAVYFRVKVKKAGHYYLTVNQESKKRHLDINNYKYHEATILFGKKLSNGTYEYAEGSQGEQKSVSADAMLTEGEYIVYVKMNWRDQKPREFVLSSYGIEDTEIEVIPKSSCPDFLEKVYESKGRQAKKVNDYSYLGVKDCFNVFEATDDGFWYIYYRNNSQKTLNETFSFHFLEGLRFRKPYRGNSFDIVVKPGEEKCVIMKVDMDSKKIGADSKPTVTAKFT